MKGLRKMRKITVQQSKRMCKKLNGNRRGIVAKWDAKYNLFYVDLPQARMQVVPNYYEKGLWGVEIMEYLGKQVYGHDYKNIKTERLEAFITLAYLYLTAGENVDLSKLTGIGEKV